MNRVSLAPFLAPSAGLAGLLFDELFGEPPTSLHPVAWMGRGIGRIEQRTYRDDRGAGLAHLLIAAAGTLGVATVVERLVGDPVATAAGVGLAGSGRMLREVATTVGAQLEAGDLEGARETLTSLVGRDPTLLNEAEIVRAVVESVAENTVDAVTATLFWAAVGGSTGLWLHRAVNTLDAMVGHRSDRYQRFGWASARADDLMNWLPARLTAFAVALAVPRRTMDVARIVVRDGGDHPSPNGGQIESAFAAALGVSLGGTNNYGGTIEVRGRLGDGPNPQAADIARAVQLSRRASWIFAVGAAVMTRWSGRPPQ